MANVFEGKPDARQSDDAKARELNPLSHIPTKAQESIWEKIQGLEYLDARTGLWFPAQ